MRPEYPLHLDRGLHPRQGLAGRVAFEPRWSVGAGTGAGVDTGNPAAHTASFQRRPHRPTEGVRKTPAQAISVFQMLQYNVGSNVLISAKALLRGHFENDFQLYRGAERKTCNTINKTSRVFLFSEYVLQKLRGAIGHLWVFANVS